MAQSIIHKRITAMVLVSLSVIFILIMTPVSAADYSPDKVLIKYVAPDGSNDTSALTNGEIHSIILTDHSGIVPGLYALKLPSDVSVQYAIEYYSNISGVEYVEPDYYLTVGETTTPVNPDTITPIQSHTTSVPAQTSSPFSIAGMILGIGLTAALLRKI